MKTTYSVGPKLISNLLEDVFGNDGLVSKGIGTIDKAVHRYPPVNISKDNQAYYLEILAAGVSKDLISIDVKEGILSISYEDKEVLEEGVQKIKSEFMIASFERKFKLDDKVDAKLITAQHENGILKITLPLRAELQPVERKIEIA